MVRTATIVGSAAVAATRPGPTSDPADAADAADGPDGTAVATARAEVHAASCQMVADGLVVGSAGNISLRVDARRFVVTAGGVPYHRLCPDDHPVVDLATGGWEGPRRPTSELALHVGLMAADPDLRAIVHTHSRYAAAFAVARLDLPFICNESLATRAEQVLVTDYAPPGSADLAARARAAFDAQPGSRAVLLANHGVVAVGASLEEAYVVAQSVEWTAEICHLARTLVAAGVGEHVLDAEVQAAIARNYDVTIARRRVDEP
jgi:L-fuculose-phosphate aldolase